MNNQPLRKIMSALNILAKHLQHAQKAGRYREDGFQMTAFHMLAELFMWGFVKPKSVKHETFLKALNCIKELERNIEQLKEAEHRTTCDECGFECAINLNSDDWRNICPICEFSWIFSLSVVAQSIRKYGVFPPPLTIEEELKAVADNGFSLAGIAESAPEEIRDLARALLG